VISGKIDTVRVENPEPQNVAALTVGVQNFEPQNVAALPVGVQNFEPLRRITNDETRIIYNKYNTKTSNSCIPELMN